MLIRVQIFTHLISRAGLVSVGWRGGGGFTFRGGFKYGLKVMRTDSSLLSSNELSSPFSRGGVDQIRPSPGGERFHSEHEVIALIEVASLTYYIWKPGPAPSRARYGNMVAADAIGAEMRAFAPVKGLWGFDGL